MNPHPVPGVPTEPPAAAADGDADHLAPGTNFTDSFAQALLNPHAWLITGVGCGSSVEDVEDPLMQQIQYLDTLVDELARGRRLNQILRA